MKYIPPFEILKSYVSTNADSGELMVTCTYEAFVGMIRRVLLGVDVDEAWYLSHYTDIADAIEKGLVTDARSHFINDGYFEGRMPFPIRVDEAYYLGRNAGVADFVRRGLLESGQQHFDENGYKEGRLPFGL
jgi:hypothetical protein